MKILPLLLFFLVFSSVVYGQSLSAECKCAVSQYSGTKADTIFHLLNNTAIALCGSRDTANFKRKIRYSEFVLSVCGSNKIIKFWGAVTICDVKVANDTLLVETMVNLPVGNAMSYEETIWTTEHIYIDKGRAVRDSVINSGIAKYSPSQIDAVLKLYDHSPDENNEKTSELIDKLFICALSGSYQAKNDLKTFPEKFKTLSGVYYEQYDDIMGMLADWGKR